MRRSLWIGVCLAACSACNVDTPPTSDSAVTPPAAAGGASTTERVEATAGVGKASQNRGDAFFGTSLKAGVHIRETLELDINLKHALDLYKAEKGYFPRSEDDFWKYVKQQQITLPKLPDGHRYVYDPDSGKLMVERPTQ